MIELMRFQLAEGVDLDEFLSANEAVQTEFAYQQPGLVRRTVARGEHGWMVIDLWRSAEESDACNERWGKDPVTQAFDALVDPQSVHVYRYNELD